MVDRPALYLPRASWRPTQSAWVSWSAGAPRSIFGCSVSPRTFHDRIRAFLPVMSFGLRLDVRDRPRAAARVSDQGADQSGLLSEAVAHRRRPADPARATLRRVRESLTISDSTKLLAAVSLVVWAAAIASGRLLAYTCTRLRPALPLRMIAFPVQLRSVAAGLYEHRRLHANAVGLAGIEDAHFIGLTLLFGSIAAWDLHLRRGCEGGADFRVSRASCRSRYWASRST